MKNTERFVWLHKHLLWFVSGLVDLSITVVWVLDATCYTETLSSPLWCSWYPLPSLSSLMRCRPAALSGSSDRVERQRGAGRTELKQENMSIQNTFPHTSQVKHNIQLKIVRDLILSVRTWFGFLVWSFEFTYLADDWWKECGAFKMHFSDEKNSCGTG